MPSANGTVISNGANKIVILGLGNILMRDEGIGVVLLEELRKEESLKTQAPLNSKHLTRQANLYFIDGGTASYEALRGIEADDFLIVLDAAKGEGEPGTIHLLKPEDLLAKQMGDVHQSDLHQTLRWLEMEGRLPEVIIFGVEVADTSWGEGLSHQLAKRLPAIKEKIISEITRRAQNKLRTK